MKRFSILFLVAVLLAAFPASHLALAKGHVPAHKDQVCHKGNVIEIDPGSVADHEGHGDIQLPACDFANVFHAGDSCDNTLATRIPADGSAPPFPATPACAGGGF